MLTLFKFPFIIFTCILAHLILQHGFGQLFLANVATWIGIAIGSYQLLVKTFIALSEKKFTLDYIAILSITLAIFGHYYLVATIIILMLSGGYALETYGLATAKRSLSELTDRIPSDAQLWENGHIVKTLPIADIKVGQEILIRKGEVIPLDGTLTSDFAETDESSISGEPYFLEKHKGDHIRSGTVNIGEAMVILVTAEDHNSTYRNIINMVQQAQLEKSPMIRMADRYSLVFTVLTFGMALIAYWVSHDTGRVLAVLVVATPCPLILAAPIALMGGVSAASKYHIIVKRLGSLETLSRVQALLFDKTGTLTLGKPTIKKTTCFTTQNTESELLSIYAAIERNSLHPFAKTITQYAKDQKAALSIAKDIKEIIGHGITGVINNSLYSLSKIPESSGMSIGLYDETKTLLLQFDFEDELKTDSKKILEKLSKKGLQLFLLTGDKKDRTQHLVEPLGIPITVQADCTPEQKKETIMGLKKKGFITAMIGDGINDAPALAAADVGMVFSHEEQTASTDSADIVFLGGDLSLVIHTMDLSTQTIQIARHCILFGMTASGIGMICASLGYLPPISGAFLQEAIDIIVILYALRASTIKI